MSASTRESADGLRENADGPRENADGLERALRRGASGASAEPDAPARAQGACSGEAGASARAARRLSARIAADDLADISYAPVDSPFGPLLAAATRRGLVRLAFPEEDVDATLEGLALRISPRIVELPGALDRVRRELDEYFAGARHTFELAQDWRLMGRFQSRVLRATYEIPYGAVSSYAEVAADAGSPRGSRAAGNALGANPIPIVVPCHRVLRSGGSLGGYGGGLQRKRWLLELEGGL